jgi:hypothetical protein
MFLFYCHDAAFAFAFACVFVCACVMMMTIPNKRHKSERLPPLWSREVLLSLCCRTQVQRHVMHQNQRQTPIAMFRFHRFNNTPTNVLLVRSSSLQPLSPATPKQQESSRILLLWKMSKVPVSSLQWFLFVFRVFKHQICSFEQL